MTFEWKDPPKHGNRHGDYDAILAELQANPGRWALIKETTYAKGGQSLKNRGCKVTSRSVGGGKFDIYAMWPPSES